MSKDTGGRPSSTELFFNGTYDIDEFHDLFIEIGDPTEYRAAKELVGSWAEWNRLKKQSRFFRENIEEWQEELRIKQRSDNIQKVLQVAKGTDGSALQAAKWIAEGKHYETNKVGRPSKKQIEKEAASIASAASESKEEQRRIKEGLLALKKASTAIN